MFEAVDLYCERLGPGFWAEPVNALTNLFFFLAAWLAWRLVRRRDAGSPAAGLLVGLLFAIGIGSFLFHTFATRWAELADILPILLFQFVFVWLYCREVARMGRIASSGVLAGYFATVLVAARFLEALNGSMGYVPALLILLALGLYHAATRKGEPFILLVAAGLFLVSLTLRTVDLLICPCFSLGTHFLWHTLNPVVLYLVFRGWLINRTGGGRPGN